MIGHLSDARCLVRMTYFFRFIFGLTLIVSKAVAAGAAPAELVVFPEVLPAAPHGYDGEASPVIRWDKTTDPKQAGVTLTTAEKSVFKKPEAVMAYDADGATLLIHVIDDPAVMAPATRLAQESLITGKMPTVPGVPAIKPTKIAVTPASGSGVSVDGYLTRRDPQDPLLVVLVPDTATRKDRFLVEFSWLAARKDRASEMSEWLLKAAATIDLAKLQALH